MVGSNPPAADMKPEGEVAQMLSADGRHLVFGSKYALVAGANDSSGNLNVYDRDLVASITQLVSTTTGGTAMQAGDGISSPGLSADGSRVLIATPVSTDSAGNEYVRLYMHLGMTAASVELAPGATAGVLFGGMTADGSRVFFTSRPGALWVGCRRRRRRLRSVRRAGRRRHPEAGLGCGRSPLQPGRQRVRRPLELGRRGRRLRRGRDRRR